MALRQTPEPSRSAPPPAAPPRRQHRGRGRFGSLRALALGARLAVTGGKDTTARTVLTAVGVGLGVAMLLLAAAVPTARQHRDERIHARIDTALGSATLTPSDHTALVDQVDTVFRGDAVRGRMVRAEGADAPLPPGLERYPKPGEMFVSPALGRLLSEPGSALLRARLDHPVGGVIGERGLLGPGEYAFFLGGEHMKAGVGGTERVDRFGKVYPKKPFDPALALLTIVGIVVLLTPVAVFLTTAVRFGGEHRDRRLAALRLAGADRRMTAWIAAGEVLVGSATGVLLGTALFVVGRHFVERVTVQGFSVYARDLSPQPVLAALAVAAVLGLSVAVSLVAMRRVVAEPLGVVRRARPVRRRLWWRLALPATGLLLLWAAAGDTSRPQDPVGVTAIVAGLLMLLVGVTVVLPWVLEHLTRWAARGGPLSWQLATRRLQLSSEVATRSVNGIVVAVAGAIALLTLFTGIAASHEGPAAARAGNGKAATESMAVAALGGGGDASRYAAALARTPGVSRALGSARLDVSTGAEGLPQTVRIADCAALRRLAELRDCHEGDAFVAAPRTAAARTNDTTRWKPGDRLHVGWGGTGPRWTVPPVTATVHAKVTDPETVFPERELLVTPRAAGPAVTALATSTVWIGYDKGAPDVQDRLRTAAARLDPGFDVGFQDRHTGDPQLSGLKRALLAGVAATLLLIAASMLLGTLEQLRDGRRVLAVLLAFGTRRRTLGGSVLWQSALPMTVGLVLAVGTGTALGGVLLGMVGGTVSYDWTGILAMAGVGGAAIMVVTALALPALWRVARPDGLRHE